MYILFSFRNWSKSDPRDFRGCTHRQIRGRAEGAKFRPIAHELVDGATFLSLHPFQSNSQVLATGISLDRVSHISPRDSNPITAESILPFSSLRRIRSLHNFLPRSLPIFSQLTRRLSYVHKRIERISLSRDAAKGPSLYTRPTLSNSPKWNFTIKRCVLSSFRVKSSSRESIRTLFRL